MKFQFIKNLGVSKMDSSQGKEGFKGLRIPAQYVKYERNKIKNTNNESSSCHKLY